MHSDIDDVPVEAGPPDGEAHEPLGERGVEVEPGFGGFGVAPAAGLPGPGRRDVAVERPQLSHGDVNAERERHGGFHLVTVDRAGRGPALAAASGTVRG